MKKLLFFLLLSSCVRTEVINAPIESIDTMVVTRVDTTEVQPDTTDKVPIGFNPSVGGWNCVDIDMDL